jgi:hypothetical protein
MGVEPRLLFLLGSAGEWVGRGNESKGGRVEEFLLLLGIAPGVFGRGYYLGSIPLHSPSFLKAKLETEINLLCQECYIPSLFWPFILITYLVW